MALTKVSRGLLSTGIVDNSNATAITLNADESATFAGAISVTGALTANGGAVFNEGGADVDFRVESDINANGLVLLGDTGHVGINGSPTTYALEVFDTTGNGIAYKDTTNSVISFMGAYQSVAITGTLTNHPYALWTNSAERMRILANGKVGIGTSSPSGILSLQNGVNGTEAVPQFSVTGAVSSYTLSFFLDATAAYIGQNSAGRQLRLYSDTVGAGVALTAGATSFTSFSDERLKENIEPIENALESLSGLRTVKYHLKDVDGPEDKKKLGIIAQDLVGVIDEVIDPLTRTGDETEYLSVRYTELTPILIKAIQEQQATIEALTTRITALENN